MTNKDVEQRYTEAFSRAVPDVFGAVLEECAKPQSEKAIIVPMFERKKPIWLKMISVAAAIVIVITAGFTGSIIGRRGNAVANQNTVDSVISFDVNPSIELKINTDEKILSASALNTDAKKVLGKMNLEGSDLTVAVNAIIASLIRNGYIDELSNAILISVDNEDEEKGAELEKRLAREISDLLSSEDFDSEVISQTIKRSEEIAKLAKEYGITSGKAQLIKQIIDKDSRYSFINLAPLTIHQLNLILSGEKIQIGTGSSGNKDKEKERIGKDKAREKALSAAKLTKKDIYNYKCELDDSNKKLVYKVLFDTVDDAYSYVINAYSGKIEDYKVYKGTYFGIENAKKLAFERVGTTEQEIEQFSFSFVNKTYLLSFKLGLVEYKIGVDVHLGEIVSIKPYVKTNPNVTQSYITEAEVKAIVLEQLAVTEDLIFDYACTLTQNGNLPVYEATCKLNYNTSFKTGVLNCTYIIVAATGEVVGVGKELVETQDTPTESVPSEEQGVADQNLLQ